MERHGLLGIEIREVAPKGTGGTEKSAALRYCLTHGEPIQRPAYKNKNYFGLWGKNVA